MLECNINVNHEALTEIFFAMSSNPQKLYSTDDEFRQGVFPHCQKKSVWWEVGGENKKIIGNSVFFSRRA